MSQKRLMLLCTAGSIGGTERVTLSLARQFASRKWTVRTVFAPDPATPSLLAWARELGVEAEVDPALAPMSRPRTAADMAALRALIRGFRPDVVNLHYGGNHLSIKDVLAVRLAGVSACFVNAHLPTPWGSATSRKKIATRIAATMSRRVIAHSQDMRASLMEAGIASSRIAVILNGVPVPRDFPERSAARRRLGLPENAFVVASMGRLTPIKGMDDLILAVSSIDDSAGLIRLVIAGDGPDRQALEALAHERMPGRVQFLGHIANSADFFAASDVFALASLLEGYPLVLLEAAMYGLPCVATNVGGVAEAIDDQHTGFVVPPRDQQAIASAVARLRDEELRRRLGAAARKRAREEFSEESMAARYEDTFTA